MLTAAALLALAPACAPGVAPETLLALARAESRLNPWAIGLNHTAVQPAQPSSRDSALTLARDLAARGANFDLGLLQINSANLGRLGLSLEDALDPCRNLAAGASVLSDAYARTRVGGAEPQAALRVALSRYNTGDPQRGFRNGYVARVEAAAALVPDLNSSPARRPAAATVAPWDVFASARAAFVLTPEAAPAGAAP